MKRIELGWIALVLIVIIGATAINLSLSKLRSRDAQRKADLNSMAAAVQGFHDDFTYYPESRDGRIVACGDPAYRNKKYYFDLCEWGNNITPLHFVDGGRVPTDPRVVDGWQYFYTSDGRNYQLYASLEDKDDPEVNPQALNLGLFCGNQICNFTVASDNK